jgi:uncharacterized protein YkwD
MRRPWVPVAIMTGVLLVAGAVAAATAGAAATPDDPAPGDDGWAMADWWTGAGPWADADPAADPDPGATPAADAGSVADPAPAAAPLAARPAADATPAADAPADSGTQTGSGLQTSVLRLVNRARDEHGCRPLGVDGRLVAAARGHAEDMAAHGYFAHRSPSGASVADRVADAGYDWSRYAENIARGQEGPSEVVDGWLHSPVHRENILNCELTEVGVGRAFDDDGRPYWVQDLATPK